MQSRRHSWINIICLSKFQFSINKVLVNSLIFICLPSLPVLTGQEGASFVKKIGGVFAFKVKDGPDGKEGTWYVDVKNGTGCVHNDTGKRWKPPQDNCPNPSHFSRCCYLKHLQENIHMHVI